MDDDTIERELGPFEGVNEIAGVEFDGSRLWCATGSRLLALDPADGKTVDAIEVPADAGTAFDGRYIYQLGGGQIRKIDPRTHEVVRTLPSPIEDRASGMAWAEGHLWIGEWRGGKIHRVDPESGEVLATLETKRFVTGVTWAGQELWHGAQSDDRYELVHIDPDTQEALERIPMVPGVAVSGMAADREGRIFCGGGKQGRVRVVRRRTR